MDGRDGTVGGGRRARYRSRAPPLPAVPCPHSLAVPPRNRLTADAADCNARADTGGAAVTPPVPHRPSLKPSPGDLLPGDMSPGPAKEFKTGVRFSVFPGLHRAQREAARARYLRAGPPSQDDDTPDVLPASASLSAIRLSPSALVQTPSSPQEGSGMGKEFPTPNLPGVVSSFEAPEGPSTATRARRSVSFADERGLPLHGVSTAERKLTLRVSQSLPSFEQIA